VGKEGRTGRMSAAAQGSCAPRAERRSYEPGGSTGAVADVILRLHGHRLGRMRPAREDDGVVTEEGPRGNRGCRRAVLSPSCSSVVNYRTSKQRLYMTSRVKLIVFS
jgi:hypothetical protein